jgi:hypothetical protein
VTNKNELEMGIDSLAETNDALLRQDETIDDMHEAAAVVLFAAVVCGYFVSKLILKRRRFP